LRILRVLLAVAVTAGIAPGAEPPLVQILRQELHRSFRILKEKADPAPYFLSYGVTDQHTYNVAATLGTLVSATQNRSRLLDVSLRVGDYKLDNYHRLRGQFSAPTSGALTLSLDDDAESLQASLWAHTDRKYRQAAERLIRIRTNRAVKVEEEDLSWPRVFFDTAPDRNESAHELLAPLGDDSPTYYWRVLAARDTGGGEAERIAYRGRRNT